MLVLRSAGTSSSSSFVHSVGVHCVCRSGTSGKRKEVHQKKVKKTKMTRQKEQKQKKKKKTRKTETCERLKKEMEKEIDKAEIIEPHRVAHH